MEEKTFQPSPKLSAALILVGVLIGLLLALLATWADYESTMYGFPKRAATSFQGLSCPVFIGRNENSVVSIKVSNSTRQPLSPSVRSEVSTPLVSDAKIEYVKLAPGEQMTLQRSMGPENIDLGRFIFVYTLVYSAYPMPSQESTCGVFVLPVNGNGSLILILGISASVLLMSIGLFLLYKNGMAARRSRSLVFMVIITVITMIFAFIGWWIYAIIMLVVLILMLVISFGSLLRY